MAVMKHGMIRSHHSKIDIIYRLLDVLFIIGGLLFSSWFYNYPWNPHFNFFAALSVIFFYLLAKQSGLYASWRTSSISQEIGLILRSWLMIMLIILFIAFLMKFSGPYLRRVIITWFLLTLCLLSTWRTILRIFLRFIRKKGANSRTVVIGGAGYLGCQLASVILHNTWMGFKCEGFYDDYISEKSLDISGMQIDILGNLNDLVDDVKSKHLDLVYFALPMRAEARLKNILDKLADTTASVYIVPDVFTFGLLNARLVDMNGIPTISVYEGPFYGIKDWIKRLEDIVIGLIIMLMITPIMVAIALGVKMSSPGPVIFKQRRYGFNGEEIYVWKFRTMSVCEDGPDIPQAQKNDPRVTKYGEFLRKTSLDELPQFINVLQGRMSIVGPRPHAVAHNEYYRNLIPGYMLRHKVKPGITGWAQVNGWRGETDTLEKMQKRVDYDLAYIRNWSFWMDMKIIFMTVFGGFGGKNAY